MTENIDGIYAYMVEGPDGQEFFLNSLVGGHESPMISRNVEELVRFRAMAAAFVKSQGLKVRLVHFAARRDLDTLTPLDKTAAAGPPKEPPPARHADGCTVGADGRCGPCFEVLSRAVRTLMDYLESSKKAIKEAGKLCQLCEPKLADPAIAMLVSEVASIRKGRQDTLEFIASLNTLLALFRDKLGTAEFPETDLAVKRLLGKAE